MMDCKKALTESAGDFVEGRRVAPQEGHLEGREQGRTRGRRRPRGPRGEPAASSASWSSSTAETDFVARNDAFVKLLTAVSSRTSRVTRRPTLENLHEQAWTDGKKVKDALTEQIATIGENISVRRFERFQVESNGVVGSYLHSNNRVGALVEVLGSSGADAKALASELSMQATAMRPAFVSREQIPADVLEKEKEAYRYELNNTWKFTIKDGAARTGVYRSEDAERVMVEISGKLEKVPLTQIIKREQITKPENMWDKIIAGKIEKFFENNCLVDQLWVKDDKLKIKDVIAEAGKKAGASLTVGRVARIEVGEGIEKKKDDLAAEVAKTLGQA
jgi:elongation factor Ts